MKKYYTIPFLSMVTISLLAHGWSAQAEIKETSNSTAAQTLNTTPIRATARGILDDSGQETLSEEKTEIIQSAQSRRRRRRRRTSKVTAKNYLGLGGSLGLIEDAYGDFGALAVTSKLRFLKVIKGYQGGTDLSLRPSVIVGKDVTFTVPVTIDFRLPGFSKKMSAFVPYIGGGLNATTGDDSSVDFLLSGGVDFPLEDFTVNGQLNVGFLDDTALGLTLSIGYNF